MRTSYFLKLHREGNDSHTTISTLATKEPTDQVLVEKVQGHSLVVLYLLFFVVVQPHTGKISVERNDISIKILN